MPPRAGHPSPHAPATLPPTHAGVLARPGDEISRGLRHEEASMDQRPAPACLAAGEALAAPPRPARGRRRPRRRRLRGLRQRGGGDGRGEGGARQRRRASCARGPRLPARRDARVECRRPLHRRRQRRRGEKPSAACAMCMWTGGACQAPGAHVACSMWQAPGAHVARTMWQAPRAHVARSARRHDR